MCGCCFTLVLWTVYLCVCTLEMHSGIAFHINKQSSSLHGPCPRPLPCPFPDSSSDTHLGKVEFELLAVELRLVQLDSSPGSGLWGAEVDPHSPETFEHLEICLFIVDPEQRLKALLQKTKTQSVPMCFKFKHDHMITV